MAYEYVLVVGSRSVNDRKKIFDTLDRFCDKHSIIVSGGARGVDSIAEEYADSRGLQKVIMPAKWDVYGKSAGYIRNEEMHKYISQHINRICVAFWDGVSKGTADNFKLVKKYDTPLQVVRM